jgi:hypothetical protein
VAHDPETDDACGHQIPGSEHTDEQIVRIDWKDYARGIASVAFGPSADGCAVLDRQFEHSFWAPSVGGCLEVDGCGQPSSLTGYERFCFEHPDDTPPVMTSAQDTYYLEFASCGWTNPGTVVPIDPPS